MSKPGKRPAAKTTLKLPDGRTTPLFGDRTDNSVFKPVAASGGLWEPHLMRLFETAVSVDSVCLDLGANIGVHTLAMASLARQGRVWAIEAGEVNFGYLERNVTGLASPRADVRPLKHLVWDRSAPPPIVSMKEAAGCAFISPAADLEDAERMIRAQAPAVVDAVSSLHMTFETPEPITLDEWADRHAVERLDVIKMDIEGSEPHALAGGVEMLTRLKPVLITEYNPLCAEIYWGDSRDSYYHILSAIYADIRVARPDGALISIADWADLDAALKASPGLVDLCCSSLRSDRRSWPGIA